MKLRTKKVLAVIGMLPLIICLLWIAVESTIKNGTKWHDIWIGVSVIAMVVSGFVSFFWLIENWNKKDK